MRTRIKVCGLTRGEDAEAACVAGVDALGFVFWPRSPRVIRVDDARAIVRSLPPYVAAVGVFVDQPADEINHIVALVGLHVAQLHGDEPVADWSRIDVAVTKAVSITPESDAAMFERWPPGVMPLLDAADPERRGGTGRTIDWDRAAAVAATRPIVLAGGLRPDNVEDAVRRVRPFAIDVSSGVERSPGVKDHDLIHALVAAVHRADARL